MAILGIDIGGSGIKGGLVDLTTGQLIGDRHRVPTPQPSTPMAMADVVADLVSHYSYRGPVGCAFPAPIMHGVAKTAANVSDDWIGTNGEKVFGKRLGLPVRFINDADAAGIAEMEFGAGRGETGVVMMVTLGTGIGTAIFTNRMLLPNTELGHLPLPGRKGDAESWASDRVRKDEGLRWKAWAERLQEYFDLLELLFSPDLIIVGGGVSAEHERFLPELRTRARMVPAGLLNHAGIVGAAQAAAELQTT